MIYQITVVKPPVELRDNRLSKIDYLLLINYS
jgi:hypothetical protein